MDNDEILTPSQVAERLQVPIRTVREWLRNGTLQGTKIKNRWQIDESALAETEVCEARHGKDETERRASPQPEWDEPSGEVASTLFRVLGGRWPRS